MKSGITPSLEQVPALASMSLLYVIIDWGLYENSDSARYVRIKSGTVTPTPIPVIANRIVWVTSHRTEEMATSIVPFDLVRNACSCVVRLFHPSSVYKLSMGMPADSIKQLCCPVQYVLDTSGHCAHRQRLLRISMGIWLFTKHFGAEVLHE